MGPSDSNRNEAGMKNSSWTGRAPRSLQDAFGPYTDRYVYDTSPKDKHGWVYAAVCLVASAAIGAILAFGA